MAIEQALSILNWYENHFGDDLPPPHIWEDPKGLEQHWEKVKIRHEEKYGTGGSSSSSEDMTDNELAREFKR